MQTLDTGLPAVRNAVEKEAWRRYDAVRIVNPTQQELRELALTHTPAALATATGSLNKVSRNKARMAQHTYVVSDAPGGWSHRTVRRAEAERLINLQADYIRAKGTLLEIQGQLGVGPQAVAVQWLYTLEGANIAGMQQVLAFPPAAPFEPTFRVVYTPDLRPDVPGRQRILVDLEHRVTYIMGADYFGESKKAALRMLCDHAFHQGGLVLHAGAKEVRLGDRRIAVAILGLSGTGKTTTTFSRQGDGVRPVQDDMVTLWPGGRITVTENGCFAKTFGLSEESEPVLWRGSLSAEAWLENTYQDPAGCVAFDKTLLAPEEVAHLRDVLVAAGALSSHVERYMKGEVRHEDVVDEHGVPRDGWDFAVWTENGRSILPMSAVEDAADPTDIPPVRSMGVLNRDEGAGAITPGLVRFVSPEQAAGYFMLGETTKTSAAGKDRGRTRSPFTQPFFPREHGLQARRFAEIVATAPELECWMMNTGYVGGDAKTGVKVRIAHSSALLEALFAGRIAWTRDPDFGYEVVDVDHPDNAALVAAVGAEVLRPHRLYARRPEVYREEVERRHADRLAFLREHGVDEAIVRAVVP